MKKTIFTFFSVLFCAMISMSLTAQNELITVWKTDNSGTSGSTEITIPTNTVAHTYKYDVDWNNDGVYDEFGIRGDVTHDFGATGTNTIRIRGDFPQFYFNNSGDKLKILDVLAWGSIQWFSGESAFFGCSNLDISATDTIDFSQATNLEGMFRACSNLNSPNVAAWDMSNIRNVNSLFKDCSNFNQDLSAWNVGSVIDMEFMFAFARSFDNNLGSWEIDSVSSMRGMFLGTSFSSKNYDATLVGWASQSVKSDVDFNGGFSKYCGGDSSRYHLTSTMNWTISDAGQDCTGQEIIAVLQTDKSSTEITIPTNNAYVYKYDVDWDNDGIYDEYGFTGDATNDFSTIGKHTIRIKGTFPQFYLNNDECSDTSSFGNSTTAVEDVEMNQILVYPNPSNGTFKVDSDQPLVAVSMLDLLGRSVNADVDLATGMIHCAAVSTGKYVVHITTETTKTIQKVEILN